jgi:probable phosphoglycerate mutase
MSQELPLFYLARHGETEWSDNGRHTGLTDIPLTPRGERNAQRMGERLKGISFEHVFTSPLQRARRTCDLAGFGDRAQLEADLREVDYGEYEGRLSEDIRRERPGWDLFRDGCPGGESIAQVTARADRVIARLHSFRQGNVLIFAHKHFLQFLTARWICLPVEEARRFFLTTAALSILGCYPAPGVPVVRLWNDDRHVGA